MTPSKGYSITLSTVTLRAMPRHSRTRTMRACPQNLRSLSFGWLIGWLMVILCLLTLLPMTLLPRAVRAQVLLPVVIELPPSFLNTPLKTSSAMATSEKVELAARQGVMKEMVGVPVVTPQIAAVHNAEVRATELRGLLPHQSDFHYFGLDAIEPGGGFAVTLVVEPAAALVDDAVNFVVLTEDGLNKFWAGVDPLTVKTAIGSPLLFDQVGNRLTALVPGNADTRYTVLVYNNGKAPVTYTLQVQGGVLRDNAGQTFSSIKVSAPGAEELVDKVERINTQVKGALTSAKAMRQAHAGEAHEEVAYEGFAKRMGIVMGIATPVAVPSPLQQLLPEPVRARQVSGELLNLQERHYLNLATDTGGGDVVLTLHYRGASDAPSRINFWVMTQDGVRHLVQGALAQELNLATGLPVAGEPGVYQARLRMAQNMLYTVVVFSESNFAAHYTLSVQGGILVDRYGQTRESHAAEMELLALSSE